MARGGFRPGAGRPRKAVVADPVPKKRGRPRKTEPTAKDIPAEPKKRGRPRKNPVAALPLPVGTPADPQANPFVAAPEPTAASSNPAATSSPSPGGPPEFGPGFTPLEYMLHVMNDDDIDPNRRDRMAVAAAPFVHVRAGEVGKKEKQQEAAKAAGGKFSAAGTPPKLVVYNK